MSAASDLSALSRALDANAGDAGHHAAPDVPGMLARAAELCEIERTAARYLAALDGRLGPLDYATPEEELARLRELLAGSHAHLR